MFGFLKKEKKKVDKIDGDNPIAASINYYIREDGSPFADIHVAEMDKKSIELLTDLLIGITLNHYLDTTIEMIKDHFIETDNLDLYLTMASKIAALYDDKGNKEEEEPCIRPSDAL